MTDADQVLAKVRAAASGPAESPAYTICARAALAMVEQTEVHEQRARLKDAAAKRIKEGRYREPGDAANVIALMDQAEGHRQVVKANMSALRTAVGE